MSDILTMRVHIRHLAITALETQERHHVQWYLEKILVELGFDPEEIRRQEQKYGYDWEPGIAP